MAARRRSQRRGQDAEAEPPGHPEDPPGDPEDVARNICLRLLTGRPRTRAELATALRKRGIPDEAAEAVLGRFGEVGLVDDEAFSRAWVSSRHAGRGLARRALAAELRRKGVADETVQDAVGELDSDLEARTARSLVDRRLRTLGTAPPEVRLRRLVGMLARKGYPPGLAARVVREALADAAAEEELEALESLSAADSL